MQSPVITDPTRLAVLDRLGEPKLRTAVSRGYLDGWEGRTREWKYTFAGQFLTKNPELTKTLDQFRQNIGHIPEWNDLTDRNLREWRDALAEYLCPSSLRNVMARIKAVISLNAEDVDLNISQTKCRRILNVRPEPSQAVYLTDEEMDALWGYSPTGAEQKTVWREFMAEYYSGARSSDVLQMTLANIREGILSYVSKKTRRQVELPANPRLSELLDRRPMASDAAGISKPRFNGMIRQMCLDVGITEPMKLFRRGREEEAPKYRFVATHTARRSFATNLYKRGADILTISRFMGHSSVTMTQRYIVGFHDKLPTNVDAFFSNG